MELRSNGKIIGTVVGGTLIKKGKQVHLFNNYDGFGISTEALNNPLVRRVQVYYGDDIYEAPVETFAEKGIPYSHPSYDDQLILPRRYFSKDNLKQARLF